MGERVRWHPVAPDQGDRPEIAQRRGNPLAYATRQAKGKSWRGVGHGFTSLAQERELRRHGRTWLRRVRYGSLPACPRAPDRERSAHGCNWPWPALPSSARWPDRAGPAPPDRRAGAQVVLLLVGVEGLLRKDSRLHRRVVAGARLLQADHGVLHVHAHLVDLLLQIEFVLPDLDHAGRIVGLRGAIAQRDVQREAGRVIRIIAAEDLRQQIPVAAGQIADAGLTRPKRSLAGQAVVGQFGKGLQSRLQGILDADQIHLVAVEIECGSARSRRGSSALPRPDRPRSGISSLSGIVDVSSGTICTSARSEVATPARLRAFFRTVSCCRRLVWEITRSCFAA